MRGPCRQLPGVKPLIIVQQPAGERAGKGQARISKKTVRIQDHAAIHLMYHTRHVARFKCHQQRARHSVDVSRRRIVCHGGNVKWGILQYDHGQKFDVNVILRSTVLLTHIVFSDSSFIRAARCSSHRTLPAESTEPLAPAAAPAPPSPSPRAAARATSPNHRCCSPPAIAADSFSALALALGFGSRLGTLGSKQDRTSTGATVCSSLYNRQGKNAGKGAP